MRWGSCSGIFLTANPPPRRRRNGRTFAAEMDRIFAQKIAGAREITLAEMDGRPLWIKLRDAIARLFSPYL